MLSALNEYLFEFNFSTFTPRDINSEMSLFISIISGILFMITFSGVNRVAQMI